MRRAQATTEYMLTIAVLVISVFAVMAGLTRGIYDRTGVVAQSLSTSLTKDGVQ